MLLSLKIENYVLIRSCDIDFQSGFSCITGETGAGKSILLGALSLVLGHRADMSVLADKERKCVVEAVFSVNENMKQLFNDNDLDFDEHSIFRREITPSGKSRAFINDTPVQQSVMKMFADLLVDIHSQSSAIKLKKHDYQLEIVDSVNGDNSMLKEYSELHKQYRQITKELDKLTVEKTESEKERSYNEFLFEELNGASLQIDEQQVNERMQELYSNSEKIKDNIVNSLQILNNEQDNNILGMLNETNHRLSKIASHNELLASLYQRMESATIEMKDIYEELSSFNDNLDFDPDQMDKINDRLSLIYSLERKHNVNSVEELLQIKDELQQKILYTDNIDSLIEQKTKQKESIVAEMERKTDLLHRQRQKNADFIVKQTKPLLDSMAMKDAVLKIEVCKKSEFNDKGKDEICFLFNANKTKSDDLQELSSSISGGELSRLILAIKSVVAIENDMPTMIFDEIDTGISGDIASKTADIMRMMGVKHQVIAITHLVQIAAKSNYQYKVYKTNTDGQTQSNILLLDGNERVEELAKMLSGDEITQEAIANAKKLLLK